MRYLGELQLAFEGEKTDCHSDRRPIISASHPKHQSDVALFVAMGVLGTRALRGTDYAYLGRMLDNALGYYSWQSGP